MEICVVLGSRCLFVLVDVSVVLIIKSVIVLEVFVSILIVWNSVMFLKLRLEVEMVVLMKSVMMSGLWMSEIVEFLSVFNMFVLFFCLFFVSVMLVGKMNRFLIIMFRVRLIGVKGLIISEVIGKLI